MKLTRRKRHGSVVEASALSDILFFLLLFFLMMSTLASPSAIKLLLPKAKTGQNISKNIIGLGIDENLVYYIEDKPVSVENLKALLEKESKKAELPTIVVRAHKSIPVEELIKVIDIVNQLKLPMVIATEKIKQ
ncbi:MAG: biopolymer transporter ExbD [Saprospiraceae bacterium]|jgi:biopolymer transport protein ExbD|nr:biopolymer transporter ExbD [Saprospiraceae bacterium]